MSFPPNFFNATVTYTLNRTTGMRIADLPEELRKRKPFIPDFDTPYCSSERLKNLPLQESGDRSFEFTKK